jgi:glyoxylase-like metal-dependent hydrolase (beta-lactamase superfamily II)
MLAFDRRARAESPRLDAVRLSPRVLAVSGPDANVVAVEGDDGVILVDGGSAAWSDALLARVDAEFGSKPIRALVNTHWHPEHVGSNVALGSRGTEIVAHENTKLWLGTEIWVRWSGEKYPPLPAAGLPTKTFVDSSSFELAGRTVDCRYLLNAHTDGDACALFADENVLVTGGAVSNAGWPVIDWWTGGWIGGMLDAYDALIDMADEGTRIVPSRGPAMSLRELRSQQAMYVTIFDRLEGMLRKSFGTDEVLAARPTAEFDEQWGDSKQFVTLAFHSMWGHVRDAYDTRLRTIP